MEMERPHVALPSRQLTTLSPFLFLPPGENIVLITSKEAFPGKRRVEGVERTAESLFLDKARDRQDRGVNHPEDRMQTLAYNTGPGIPDVAKAPSLPARKIGLVTILAPNGRTLCSLELHLLG